MARFFECARVIIWWLGILRPTNENKINTSISSLFLTLKILFRMRLGFLEHLQNWKTEGIKRSQGVVKAKVYKVIKRNHVRLRLFLFPRLIYLVYYYLIIYLVRQFCSISHFFHGIMNCWRLNRHTYIFSSIFDSLFFYFDNKIFFLCQNLKVMIRKNEYNSI